MLIAFTYICLRDQLGYRYLTVRKISIEHFLFHSKFRLLAAPKSLREKSSPSLRHRVRPGISRFDLIDMTKRLC